MKTLRTRVVTVGIVRKDRKILIMKRSETAPRYPNTWDFVAGQVKENESAENCVIREAKEECGLDVRIKKWSKSFEIIDEYGRAIIIPYVLESNSDEVKLSFEHAEYRWIEPKEIKNYECATDIYKDLKMFGLL